MSTSLYYAFGGGLGHQTRALAVRHTLGLQGKFVMLGTSAEMHDQMIEHCLAPKEMESDPAAFRAWLRDAIQRFQPQQFFVDAFPAGILGELCDFPWPPGLELIHVARLLRWDSYAALIDGTLPRYAQTWLVEELTPAHLHAIAASSDKIATLALEDPPLTPHGESTDIIVKRWAERGAPVWLIVHAGPDAETAELLAYARECAALESVNPHFAVLSPGAPLPHETEIERIDLHPASALFPFAGRIVTACGFNSMRQAAPWRKKHLCLPFARRFDDQFLRRQRAYAQA